VQKYRYYRENIDRIDTIFIGSSRFRHGVVPQIFDEEAAALGMQVHSMNMAYSGMWPPENFYFLREILALHPSHLKRVFFEVIDGKTRFNSDEDATARVAYWHDWPHTRMALRMIDESQALTTGERLDLYTFHARTFARQALLLGRGEEVLSKKVLPQKKRKPVSWLHRMGYDPEPEPGLLTGPALLAFQNRVAALKQPRPPHVMRAGLLDALVKIQAEVEAAGVEIIFVVPPSAVVDNYPELPNNLPGLLFNDIHTYSTLYDEELYYDEGHLNARGATEFSRAFARRFVESQKAQSPVP
jgi:hypothetical protein